MEKHDRASQAYCILTFADIHRQRADTDRSVPRYTAAIKMFRDIGDKFGLIQAQIGIAKSLASCEKYKDAMNYYRLAVQTCHETENKVSVRLFSVLDFRASRTRYGFMMIKLRLTSSTTCQMLLKDIKRNVLPS